MMQAPSGFGIGRIAVSKFTLSFKGAVDQDIASIEAIAAAYDFVALHRAQLGVGCADAQARTLHGRWDVALGITRLGSDAEAREIHAAERARGDPARGSHAAHRIRQPLVPRGCAQRAAATLGLCALIRALDVHG